MSEVYMDDYSSINHIGGITHLLTYIMTQIINTFSYYLQLILVMIFLVIIMHVL